jgi:hypothetical protein
MKLKLAAVSLIVLFTVFGCKKSNGPFTGVKIYTRTDFKAGIIYTYTYNTDGSVSTIQKNIGGKTTYQYNGSNVLASVLNASGVTTDATSYIINSSGYADSSQGEYLSQNISATYTYDGNGQVLQQRNYTSHTLTSTLDYSNNNAKNLASVTTTYPNGTHVYDYFNYSTSGNTIGIQNMGMFYMGVNYANLPVVDVQLNNALDTTDIIVYHYHFDGSNVDTMATYHRNGALKDSMAFTYY